jgi:hypothetical protein
VTCSKIYTSLSSHKEVNISINIIFLKLIQCATITGTFFLWSQGFLGFDVVCFSPRIWRKNGPQKSWYPTSTLNCITTQKTSSWQIITVKASNFERIQKCKQFKYSCYRQLKTPKQHSCTNNVLLNEKNLVYSPSINIPHHDNIRTQKRKLMYGTFPHNVNLKIKKVAWFFLLPTMINLKSELYNTRGQLNWIIYLTSSYILITITMISIQIAEMSSLFVFIKLSHVLRYLI